MTIQLAQQGIVNPSAEQLRAALLGGSIVTAAGTVPLQGVLQGQVRNTSDSPFFGTSNPLNNRIFRAYRVPYDWVPQVPRPVERAVVPPNNREFRIEPQP